MYASAIDIRGWCTIIIIILLRRSVWRASVWWYLFIFYAVFIPLFNYCSLIAFICQLINDLCTVLVKKVAHKTKLFGIFSLRLSTYISVKICQFVASLYAYIGLFSNFGRFILIFNKIALIFLIVFYRFKFRVLASHISLTSSPMMSGRKSPNFSPLDYRFWAQSNDGVLSQAATEGKTVSSQV